MRKLTVCNVVPYELNGRRRLALVCTATNLPTGLPNDAASFQFALDLLPILKLHSVDTDSASGLHIGSNVVGEEALFRRAAGVPQSVFVNQRRGLQCSHFVRQDEVIEMSQ